MIENIRDGAVPDSGSHPTTLDIPGMLALVLHACYAVTPVYWEGIARTHMLTGDIFREKDWSVAYGAYGKALDLLTIYPFSAGTSDEQAQMIEQALWQQFVLAFKLGHHEKAVTAAKKALEGVDYPTAYHTSLADRSYVWGPTEEVRIRGLKRLGMRIFILISLPKLGTYAKH
jgi:hypothetical protein